MSFNGVEGHTLHFSFSPLDPLHFILSICSLTFYSCHVCFLTSSSISSLTFHSLHMPLTFVLSNMHPYISFFPLCSLTFYSFHVCSLICSHICSLKFHSLQCAPSHPRPLAPLHLFLSIWLKFLKMDTFPKSCHFFQLFEHLWR